MGPGKHLDSILSSSAYSVDNRQFGWSLAKLAMDRLCAEENWCLGQHPRLTVCSVTNHVASPSFIRHRCLGNRKIEYPESWVLRSSPLFTPAPPTSQFHRFPSHFASSSSFIFYCDIKSPPSPEHTILPKTLHRSFIALETAHFPSAHNPFRNSDLNNCNCASRATPSDNTPEASLSGEGVHTQGALRLRPSLFSWS